MIRREAFALLVPLLGLALAFVMDRAAALRRPGGERGDFWTRAVAGLCAVGCLCLLSGWLPAISERLWLRGWHLQLDRVPGSGLPANLAFLAALALPFAFWALLLLLGLALRPGNREAGRWLAGRAGNLSRRWVLLCALPLLAALGFGYSRLGAGPEGYPAATWSTQALLAVSLLFVARSAGRATAEPALGEPVRRVETARELLPWPEALAARGIELARVAAWPADPRTRPVRGPAAAELADRLSILGARAVAPEMVEAAARILDPSRRGDERACLIFAPDGCGQAEALGLAAGDVAQRFNESTLVIAPADAGGLAHRLAPWLPAGCRAAPVGPDGKPAEDADVWVVDAETLSERFLRRLANDLLGHRIGFVAWWDVHRYTGVLAANVWAVSRRLHRLMRAQGRGDARLLVFVRAAGYGDAQLPRFIRELLPYPMPGRCEVHVERRSPRSVEVQCLTGHRTFIAGAMGARISPMARHPLLVAALASVDAGWPTCLERSRETTDTEVNTVLQLPVDGHLLQDRLLAGGAEAGARLSELDAGDVLSLVAMAREGGRAAPEGLPHHWGLLLPPNPYVEYLLDQWGGLGSRELPASRRLVVARGNPHILKRHLLLALSEQKDIREELNRTFGWEQTIQDTLDWIDSERLLDRSAEVRFLDAQGEVQSDHLYRSRLPSGGGPHTLDTVGTRLIEVRDAAGGAICLRVDPERLTIQAYPGKVFLHAGRRFQVIAWDSREQAEARGWVECQGEDRFVRTWRIRRPSVYRLERPGPEVAVDPEGRLVKRCAVDLTYEEEVEGHLRLMRDLTTGIDQEQTPTLKWPVAAKFATRALVLRLVQVPPREALEALCLALRYVLPVHLGVGDDALEVVALRGESRHRLDGTPIQGLAIVDLYPGGIGLAAAIAEDNALPLRLLEWTRDWLRQPGAGEALLGSPLARAVLGSEPPDPAAAVELLERLVGSGEG